MSRLINAETLKEEEDKVNKYFSDKKAVLDAVKVPNMLGKRMVDGYYTGDTGEDISLDEMKNFWKVPSNSGAMVDAVAKRAKLFYAGITSGGLGVATMLASDPKGFSGLIDFSDSDASLDPSDKSKLYYYLTPEEQAQYKSDESAQTATQWGSILGGLALGQPEVVMAGANPAIREGIQEIFNMRHPQLLKNAIDRRNRDIQFEYTFKNELENNKKALAETKRDYDLADVSSSLYVQKMTPLLNDIQQRSTGQSPFLPVVTNVPSVASIPVNMSVGRGLNISLSPEKYLWNRAFVGGGLHDHIM